MTLSIITRRSLRLSITNHKTRRNLQDCNILESIKEKRKYDRKMNSDSPSNDRSNRSSNFLLKKESHAIKKK